LVYPDGYGLTFLISGKGNFKKDWFLGGKIGGFRENFMGMGETGLDYMGTKFF